MKQENLALGYRQGGRRAPDQITMLRCTSGWDRAENKVPWLRVAVCIFWAL